MIWVALAALGVPLWLCAVAILTLILRNRALRRRPGNVPVRVRSPGKKRWSPGHGVWIHDVFAFRGLPAAWREALAWASDATVRVPSDHERRGLHRLGGQPIVVTLTLAEGGALELAASADHESDLLGPFAPAGREVPVAAPTG
ncbi:MAG TPA: hypothetical protein VG010_01525 [Solirubrobacteraceae bacterium]|jgi:hypothetical protein|nr:hypothetical protein [Solirubrobacteraceae bacterium]